MAQAATPISLGKHHVPLLFSTEIGRLCHESTFIINGVYLKINNKDGQVYNFCEKQTPT